MFSKFALVCTLVGLLSGCAATDTYSPRADTYNTEAQDLSNSLLIRNIIRASHRLPLQFTDIQSLTGLTSSTGGIGLSTPVGGFPATTPRTINPSVSGTLQTTFQSIVLDSQDFYQGVSAPISGVQAAYFVRSVKPSELIFSLLFSRIAIYRGGKACEKRGFFSDCHLSFANDPRNLQSAALFRETLNYLLRLGLSMETVRVWNRSIKQELKGAKGHEALKVTTEDLKDAEKRDVARYCFRPHDDVAAKAIVDVTFICGAKNAFDLISKIRDDNDQGPVVTLSGDLIAQYGATLKYFEARPSSNSGVDFNDKPEYLDNSLKHFISQNVRIEFTPRSTLDMFDYLGSIVAASRREGREIGSIRGLIGRSLGPLPCDLAPDADCSPIFALSPVLNPNALSFDIDHESLYLSTPSGSVGNSTQTLAILKQIVGLNTISKNVPVPSIITGTIVP